MATTKKINLKKETNVKENEAMVNNETVVNAETVENNVNADVNNVNAENEKENVKMDENVKNAETIETVENIPAVVDVEKIRQDIKQRMFMIENSKNIYVTINNKGGELSPTNWYKNETSRGNETLGGFIRAKIDTLNEKLADLQVELKATYYNVPDSFKALLDNESVPYAVKYLVKQSIEGMRNVIVFKYADSITPTNVQALKNAGIEEIGVLKEEMGNAMVVFTTNGYIFDVTKAQPITIEAKNIEGLPGIKEITYFSFKLAK